VHHGDLDDIIPLRASQQMVEALEKAGADVKFTRYPDLSHDSWSAAYSNLEVYRWMSGCKRTIKGGDIFVPETNKSIALE
jgi:predicted esterase